MANRYVHPILKINFNTMIARIIAIIFFPFLFMFLACVYHCLMVGTVYLPFICVSCSLDRSLFKQSRVRDRNKNEGLDLNRIQCINLNAKNEQF